MRQIFLFSEIDTFTSEWVIRQLLDLDRQSNEEITMFINSPGGSVTEMFAIIDAMNIVKSPIRTIVMGMAASAASVIASNGDTRLITANSEFMVHEAWSYTMGTATDMQEDVDRVKILNDKLMNLLAYNTGRSIDQIQEMSKKTDKWFTAQDAVQFGLADKVIQSNEAQLLKLSEAINVEGHEFKDINGHPQVELLREGKFVHPLYGEVLITDGILNQMKKNFEGNVRGIDISIDYTHDNERGESPAACWIKQLGIVRNEKGSVLIAHVEFTPKGKELVLAKEYKYASADFAIDYMNESGKHFPYVLRGGTLTNRPFIKELNPIKLSEYKPNKEIKHMKREELILALKDHGIDVTALEAQGNALSVEIKELKNQIKDLAAMPAKKDEEIKSLNAKIAEANDKLVSNEKEQAFNSLVAEGKVVPAQKSKVLSAFDSAEKLKSFYADAPAVVATKAKGSGQDNDESLTETEQEVVASGVVSKEDIIKNRTIKKV